MDVGSILTCNTYDEISEPKIHELESRAAIAAWNGIRGEITNVITESAAMPFSQVS